MAQGCVSDAKLIRGSNLRHSKRMKRSLVFVISFSVKVCFNFCAENKNPQRGGTSQSLFEALWQTECHRRHRSVFMWLFNSQLVKVYRVHWKYTARPRKNTLIVSSENKKGNRLNCRFSSQNPVPGQGTRHICNNVVTERMYDIIYGGLYFYNTEKQWKTQSDNVDSISHTYPGSWNKQKSQPQTLSPPVIVQLLLFDQSF